MLDLFYSNQFKKDYQLAKKRHNDIDELFKVIDLLREQKKLPTKYYDHDLLRKYKGYRECHIHGDFLLVYKVIKTQLQLYLYRTGSHSDLF